MYTIEIDEDAEAELEKLKPYDRNRVLDDIEDELTHWPMKVTWRKKILKALEPPWNQVGPVWQLRVGDFRVYYDVREEDRIVIVRAVRKKPPHQTTEEIL